MTKAKILPLERTKVMTSFAKKKICHNTCKNRWQKGQRN